MGATYIHAIFGLCPLYVWFHTETPNDLFIYLWHLINNYNGAVVQFYIDLLLIVMVFINNFN